MGGGHLYYYITWQRAFRYNLFLQGNKTVAVIFFGMLILLLQKKYFRCNPAQGGRLYYYVAFTIFCTFLFVPLLLNKNRVGCTKITGT
jgi:hypothetical protein